MHSSFLQTLLTSSLLSLSMHLYIPEISYQWNPIKLVSGLFQLARYIQGSFTAGFLKIYFFTSDSLFDNGNVIYRALCFK